MDKIVPRGFRNNNPLNIRIGNSWLGEVENPTDKEFEQFQAMVFGLRAGFILLRRYIRRYGLDTIRDIISRWAPASENHTAKYIEFVSQESGIGQLTKIHWEDKEILCKLVFAMVIYENGKQLTMWQIAKGYDMAAGVANL